MLINNTWIFKKKLLFINNDILFNKMKENNIKVFNKCMYKLIMIYKNIKK
jgi:hypothetical protein